MRKVLLVIYLLCVSFSYSVSQQIPDAQSSTSVDTNKKAAISNPQEGFNFFDSLQIQESSITSVEAEAEARRKELSKKPRVILTTQEDTVPEIDTVQVVSQTLDTDKEDGQFSIKNIREQSWILYLMIFFLAVFGYVYQNFGKKTQDYFKALFSPRAGGLASKEGQLIGQRSTLIYFFLFSLLMALFLYDAVLFISPEQYGPKLYFLLAGVVMCTYLVKFIALNLIGFLVSATGVTKSYLFYVFTSGLCFSILSAPLLIVFPFQDYQTQKILLWIILGILVLVFIFRYFRASVLAISNFRIPIFYIIIYLCTLEIMPILLLVKIFVA